MPFDQVTLDQLREQPLFEFNKGHFRIRCAYSRSADCQQQDHEAQDYLLFRNNARKFVFCLCDGVGGSFFGDIAAKRLGDEIINWLWSLPGNTLKQANESLPLAMEGTLNQLAIRVQEEIKNMDLGWIDPPALVPVLEKKRTNGSHTTMVCGLLQAPSKSIPDGKAIFFWLGNSRLHIWGEGINKTDSLNAIWSDRFRWTTTYGVRGPIQSYFTDLNSIDTFIAHSDGFDEAITGDERLIHDFRPGIPERSINDAINILQTLAKSDDISFIEVVYQPLQYVQQTYFTEEIETIPNEIIFVENTSAANNQEILPPPPIIDKDQANRGATIEESEKKKVIQVVYKDRSFLDTFLLHWKIVLFTAFVFSALFIVLLILSYQSGYSKGATYVEATSRIQLTRELSIQATNLAKTQEAHPTSTPILIPTATPFSTETSTPILTIIPTPSSEPSLIAEQTHSLYAPLLVIINPGDNWQFLCAEKLHFSFRVSQACSDSRRQEAIFRYMINAGLLDRVNSYIPAICSPQNNSIACSLENLIPNEIYGFFPPTPYVLLRGNQLLEGFKKGTYFLKLDTSDQYVTIKFENLSDKEILSIKEGLNSGKFSSVLFFGSFMADETIYFYPELDYLSIDPPPFFISYVEAIKDGEEMVSFGKTELMLDEKAWIYTNAKLLDDSSTSLGSLILLYGSISAKENGLIQRLSIEENWFYDQSRGGYIQQVP
jgi:hypothetical protein